MLLLLLLLKEEEKGGEGVLLLQQSLDGWPLVAILDGQASCEALLLFSAIWPVYVGEGVKQVGTCMLLYHSFGHIALA